MADDIDIDEHDVLDNPRIKNIFPDITCIKTDVIKYEDEDINDFDEESYETYKQDLTDPEIQECPVILEDNSLKNNPCFCSDCEILFPTENALNSHKMTAHSFLVAAERNKAMKSTTKSSIAASLKFETDSKMEISNLYNHCNKFFPDEKSVLKQLLKGKFSCNVCDLEFESEISFERHLRTHSAVVLYCCPICFCYFRFSNKIVSHMIERHQIDVKNVPQHLKTTYKCRLCSKVLKHNKIYNAHIRNIHPDLYYKKIHKFECKPYCNLTFPSGYSKKIHRLSHLAIESETYSTFIDLDKQIKIEPLSPTISHRVSQHAIKTETYSKSVDLDEQIKIEPLSPTIIHRVSQHEIHAETYSKSVDLNKQIKIEPLSPNISHRVPQLAIEAETYSKSVDLDKQIKIEPLSPNISHRVPQLAIEAETYSKSVDLDKQIKIEPLSPNISHRVPQLAIEAETSSKSVDLDKQIKIEPLSPTISHRVSQHEIETETSLTSIDLDKQIKIEPLV